MWPPTITACECEQPGWCPRHQCDKTPEWHYLCRQIQSDFEAWEVGEGPCLNRRPRPEQYGQLPPCVHRSADPMEHVTCDLCGNRQIQVAVYRCDLFERCTERRYGTRSQAARTTRTCLSCADYQPQSDET